jgi:hypothetical protein
MPSQLASVLVRSSNSSTLNFPVVHIITSFSLSRSQYQTQDSLCFVFTMFINASCQWPIGLTWLFSKRSCAFNAPNWWSWSRVRNTSWLHFESSTPIIWKLTSCPWDEEDSTEPLQNPQGYRASRYLLKSLLPNPHSLAIWCILKSSEVWSAFWGLVTVLTERFLSRLLETHRGYSSQPQAFAVLCGIINPPFYQKLGI